MTASTQPTRHSDSVQTDHRQAHRLLICRSDGHFETNLVPNDIKAMLEAVAR